MTPELERGHLCDQFSQAVRLACTTSLFSVSFESTDSPASVTIHSPHVPRGNMWAGHRAVHTFRHPDLFPVDELDSR